MTEGRREALRLGLFLPSAREPEEIATVAREAERLGFDSIWVPDHVLRVFGPLLDPLALLGFLAGVTSRITLGTGVLVLPYRHPVVLANVASSLDVLSDGRLVLGIGAGWNEDEFTALGMDRRERGRRTDEGLEALELLWSGRRVSHEGRFYSFRNAEIGMRPRTPGGPPVLVGGYSDRSLRRALRFGSGWMGFRDTPEKVEEVRGRLAQLADEYGRDPGELEIGTTLDTGGQDAGSVAGTLGGLSAAGVTFCALSPASTSPETLAWVAEEVAPRAGLRLSPAGEE